MDKDTVGQVLAELKALEEPKILAVNARHGDDHAVNLTKLRGLAKRLKKQPDLARELWATGDSAARLVAILVTRPKEYSATEYDEMLRDARTPKVRDWLLNYLIKKSPHAEELRLRWFEDSDVEVAAAYWDLTAERVVKKPEGLDLDTLLDLIESEMGEAAERLQWTMNTCLAQIGIHHPDFRVRAVEIGERLEILKDYPTPPNCTSPYAPIWINEIVSRQEAKA
ncbi:DNA alkylation repair protein [Flaviflexus ciconiae]|uniref:DNA alkylation repair protein n=1 Tax=Flaviflexus ciconiae TaxID=2496867 RepID=A0A3Q9G5J5_9ACTO|nr:DNA alkylation repair protein [Flaviflexus ciconiae]AZQ76313.1 DNA alkylation repair protein [Flaviflexus ciconiae]